MRLLSNQCARQVSGGTFSTGEYQARTTTWSIIGLCTVAASFPLMPAPYGQYAAVRIAALSAGTILGYTFGAVEYYAENAIKSSIDYYFSPEQ